MTEPRADADIALILADMQAASDAVDASSGTSDYQARLIALGLIARHFLRASAAAQSRPAALPPTEPR